MTVKQTIAELAEKADDLYEHVSRLSNTELTDLWEETEACESEARDLSCELDTLNDDLYDNAAILDFIPDELSAGEYDSLKEVLNKWRTEHGYPAK